MKKLITIPVALAAAATVLTTVAGPVMADSRQKNKNMWRNLAIGAGVIAGHGLITHNGTETLLGAAGAAYSANRYEQDRRSQSRASAARARYHRSYYYRTHHRRYYRTHRYSYTPSHRTHRRYYRTHRVYHRASGKYYWFQGHEYFMNWNTGQRVMVR